MLDPLQMCPGYYVMMLSPFLWAWLSYSSLHPTSYCVGQLRHGAPFHRSGGLLDEFQVDHLCILHAQEFKCCTTGLLLAKEHIQSYSQHIWIEQRKHILILVNVCFKHMKTFTVPVVTCFETSYTHSFNLTWLWTLMKAILLPFHDQKLYANVSVLS